MIRSILSRARRAGVVLAALGAGGAGGAGGAWAQSLPVAPVRPVTDTYFGTTVVDNYRYMENLDDAELQAWMKAQAGYTRARLDHLGGRAALLARIHSLRYADLVRGGFVRRGERFFYQELAPGAQLPKLFYRDGLKSRWTSCCA